MFTKTGLTQTETQNFSFTRLLRAIINPTDLNAQSAAAFELEACKSAQKVSGCLSLGHYIPREVINGFNITPVSWGKYNPRAAMTTGVPADGGNLVSTDMQPANFIDLLRKHQKVRALGAQILDGLRGDLELSKQTSSGTSYWVGEGAAPTATQQTVNLLNMTPKTVGALTDISRRLVLQSSLGVENFVRNDLASTLAEAIDLAAITGTGTGNQPLGILNTVGIGDVAGGPDGAAPTYANMIELETDVSIANADVETMGLLTTPEMRAKLKQTQRFTATDTPVWKDDSTVNGYRAVASNQVPKTLTKGINSDAHAIIFGNWSDLIIGEWGNISVYVNPYTVNNGAGTVRITVMQDVDIAIRHPESFSAMQDARNI